jgi:hypothetical protein
MEYNKNYSQQERTNHVEQWRKSGQTLTVYSEQVGIPFLILRYWVNSLLKKARFGKKKAVSPFIPIHIAGPLAQAPAGDIIVEWPTGIRITLQGGTSADYLRSLIS